MHACHLLGNIHSAEEAPVWRGSGGKRRGGQRAESQMWRVTWSNRADLRLIGFHISSMVLGLQNVSYGSEIRLQI